MSQECTVNAAKCKLRVLGHVPSVYCRVCWTHAFGMGCPPSNAGNVPSLPSCSLFCVLGGRNVALLKGILGFIVVVR